MGTNFEQLIDVTQMFNLNYLICLFQNSFFDLATFFDV